MRGSKEDKNGKRGWDRIPDWVLSAGLGNVAVTSLTGGVLRAEFLLIT